MHKKIRTRETERKKTKKTSENTNENLPFSSEQKIDLKRPGGDMGTKMFCDYDVRVGDCFLYFFW